MLWAVIMAGGSGTRFWPESRVKRPKQFLSIFGKKTLLEQTLDRLRPVIPRERVLVVTSQYHAPEVKRLLQIADDQIVGEPVGRNTAPCAVLAAALITKKDPNAVLAILPSDHRIGKEPFFRKALKAAAEIAEREGFPVTFGIQPSSPHTGYGYLERETLFKRRSGFDFYRLKRFHEKPSEKKAKAFLKTRKFLWNSGMFVWRAEALLRAAQRHLPDAYETAYKIVNGNLERGMKSHYKKMPGISIDYGLMEKLSGEILTLPVDLDWHDLGGWQAFADLWPRDQDGNVIRGEALLVNSSGNIVKSGKKLIAMLGVKDLVVVDSEDALLICPKPQTESIRNIVERLKEKKFNRYL